MSTAEIKTEIIKAIDAGVPEKVLQDVLNILKESHQSDDNIDVDAHLTRIFSKHDGLLKRLAQ